MEITLRGCEGAPPRSRFEVVIVLNHSHGIPSGRSNKPPSAASLTLFEIAHRSA